MRHTLTNSYLLELHQAIHNWSADAFKLALYGDAANLDQTIAAYTAANEIAGVGYAAGGIPLLLEAGFPQLALLSDSTKVLIDFQDILINPAAFTCRYGLIYNTSKANRSVAVLDFGMDFTTVTSFALVWPDPTPSRAAIRLGV